MLTGYIVNRRSLGLPNDHWPKENVLEIDHSSFYEKTDAWRSAALCRRFSIFLTCLRTSFSEGKNSLTSLDFRFVCGLDFQSIANGIDTRPTARRFFFHVMASLGQMEREQRPEIHPPTKRSGSCPACGSRNAFKASNVVIFP